MTYSTLIITNICINSKVTSIYFNICNILNTFLDSVNNELRNIEGKRQKLLSELALNHKKIEDSKAELVRQEAELEKLKMSVKQVNIMHLISLKI